MKTVEGHFQNTAIGKIPKYWEIKKLGEIVEFHDNKRKPIKESERKPGIYPYYGASGIIDYVEDYIFDDDYILLAEDGANILTRSTPIAFRISGKAWVNNHAHVLKPKVKTDLDYITYYLEFINYEKYNSGTAQPKLNRKVCETIDIAFPKTRSERKKIGDIISIWDKAIELKEKLIEQKKEQKKGLMQKLLTGEVRLPGFHEEWKVVSYNDVFNIVTDYVANGSFATIRENVTYKSEEDYAILLRTQDFNNNFKGPFVYIDKSAYEFLSKSSLKEGDIVISNVGAVGSVYKVPKLSKPLSLAPNAILVRSSENNTEFLYQYLSSPIGSYKFKTITSITAQPKFNKTDFKNLRMKIPSIIEQEKIAEILSLFDQNIELLEKEKKELKIQKMGLMQQLLTGKVRVQV